MALHVLVIEDDTDLRDALACLLRDAGHEPCLAKNGEEGLRLFESSQVDVVITDIVMPELDGIEAIRHIKSATPTMPVIAISGFSSLSGHNYLSAADAFGANATLPKPFRRQQLLEALDSAECHCKREASGK